MTSNHSCVPQDVLQWWQLAQATALPCSAAGQVLDQITNGKHDTRRAEEGERLFFHLISFRS